MGWVDMVYAIPAKDTRWTEVEAGIPCGYWRSVGNSQNCFFLEHTLDQTARLAGISPSLTGGACWRGHPRALAFLDAFTQAAGWSSPLAPGPSEFRDEQQWQDHVQCPHRGDRGRAARGVPAGAHRCRHRLWRHRHPGLVEAS